VSTTLALLGGQAVRTRPFPRWPIAGKLETERLRQVVERGIWSARGPEEKKFEKDFAQFCGARTAQCVSNGTVALELALRALRIGPGDEVVIPALTWTATAWAVVQVGAKPVFADVSPDDWCLDPASLSQCLSERTRAVIPVHLYDQIAEIDAIIEVAKNNSLAVIEDCAHAHGARWCGRGVGTFGDIGTFSFQEHKPMTCGEGGSVITQSTELADRIHALKDCGRQRLEESAIGFGGNFRISEFQAAILNAQLERLPEQLAQKTRRLEQFREQLNDVSGFEMLPRKDKVTRSGMYMTGLVYDPNTFDGLPRDILIAALQAEGIPVHLPYEAVYASNLWRSGVDFLDLDEPGDALGLDAQCPVADEISKQTGLTLPHSPFLESDEDIEDLVTAFRKIRNNITQLTRYNKGSKVVETIRKLFRRSDRGPK
jgi:dTDP-4-amino-4,6-dideoxygalactose transaminase